MTATKELGVALTKCFYCQEGSDILLNTRLTHADAAKVEKLNGCTISLEPCTKCQGLMQMGIIVITVKDGEFDGIEADRHKYEADSVDYDRGYASNRGRRLPFIPNPYRTGVFTVMSEAGFRRMSEHLGFAPATLQNVLSHRWTFMEDSIAELGGLYEYLENDGHKIHYRDELRKQGKDPHAEAVAKVKGSRK